MRWDAHEALKPTYLLDAAGLGYAIIPVCRCGHSAAFEPIGLWWHFSRRQWDDSLPAVQRRFWCVICQSRGRTKITPVRLDIAHLAATDIQLPLPDEYTWKRVKRGIR